MPRACAVRTMDCETRLLVTGSRERLTTFRVVGPALMAISVALRRSVEASLEEGATVRIDLRECPWMDSTFLGTLLVLARRANASGRGARFFLAAPSAECLRVLDQTGVHEVLDVIATPELGGATEWRESSSGRLPSSGRMTCLVGSHLGQALKLLVQHARDHVYFLIVELLEQRGGFVVADIGLSILVFVDENAERNEEAHAVILFGQLLPYCGIAHQKECGFEFQASH